MKLFQKKDNKGFSLVELIVVVAIMAVLMGILVPTLIKNVEKSKKQKDESAIEEIRSQMQNSLADETFSSISQTLTYSGNAIHVQTPMETIQANSDVANFLADVHTNVEDYTFTSKVYKASGVTVQFIIGDEKVVCKSNASGTKFES